MSAGPPTRPATPPCSSSSAAQPVDTAGLLPKPTIAAHDQPTGSPTRPSAHDDRSELSPEITGSPDHGIPIRSHILGTQPYRRQQYIFRGRSSFSPLRLSQLAPPTLPPRLHETSCCAWSDSRAVTIPRKTMDNAILQAEEFAWTTVVNKKKIQKELKKLRKLAGLEEEAPVTITKASVDVSDEYFVPMIEVPWFPKTSSRRAARKWSQARKSCCVGTGRGLGFFVYGSYGKYGIEF